MYVLTKPGTDKGWRERRWGGGGGRGERENKAFRYWQAKLTCLKASKQASVNTNHKALPIECSKVTVELATADWHMYK